MAHQQVPIKVNAECDEGIAPLVTALNDIDGLITYESCQQGPNGLANVIFSYGRDWQELGGLLHRMAVHLGTLNLCCGCTVSMEWFGSNDQPWAKLELKPDHMADVAGSIRDFAKGFNLRRSQSTGDTQYREPARLT